MMGLFLISGVYLVACLFIAWFMVASHVPVPFENRRRMSERQARSIREFEHSKEIGETQVAAYVNGDCYPRFVPVDVAIEGAKEGTILIHW